MYPFYKILILVVPLTTQATLQELGNFSRPLILMSKMSAVKLIWNLCSLLHYIMRFLRRLVWALQTIKNCFIYRKDRQILPCLLSWSQSPFSCGLQEVPMENWTMWTSRVFANSPILNLRFVQISPGFCLSVELIKSHLLTDWFCACRQSL